MSVAVASASDYYDGGRGAKEYAPPAVSLGAENLSVSTAGFIGSSCSEPPSARPIRLLKTTESPGVPQRPETESQALCVTDLLDRRATDPRRPLWFHSCTIAPAFSR